MVDNRLLLPNNDKKKVEGGLRTKGYLKESHPDKPLISIVTAVFNGEKFLEETIQSVLSQSYSNIEYIIIDGNSTDGTVDIIKKYESKISYWISERDKGMYDAINKGFKKASGDIFAYINADDLYECNTCELVVEGFKKYKPDLLFASTSYIDEKGNNLYHYKGVYLPRLLMKYLGRLPFAQQSCYWTAKIYKEIGGFDGSLRYVADSKFFFQIILDSKNKYIYIDYFIAKFRWHDESFSIAQRNSMGEESLRMKKKIGVNIGESIFGKITSILIEIYVKTVNFSEIFKKVKNNK